MLHAGVQQYIPDSRNLPTVLVHLTNAIWGESSTLLICIYSAEPSFYSSGADERIFNWLLFRFKYALIHLPPIKESLNETHYWKLQYLDNPW